VDICSIIKKKEKVVKLKVKNEEGSVNVKASSGMGCFGFGAALAMVISWSLWNSVGWAILHGIFSWFYVIYYYFEYGGGQ
jgi:hypothetical protein